MGTLYLVRHGQASFGAADYDQLSELGGKQSERLGRYWRERNITFDAVYAGTLRRHAQTWAGIAAGADYGNNVIALEGLNEYDSEAVIAAIHPQPLQKPETPEMVRHHFRLLRDGLRQWMNGVVSPKGMPSYADFQAGVSDALERVRKNHDGHVLIVSSGGPISTAVGHVLGTTPETTIELNLRIRNSALTQFDYNPKRHSLISFNTLPHLDHPDYAGWESYS
jgi:broad specificity phosphatase PhoE